MKLVKEVAQPTTALEIESWIRQRIAEVLEEDISRINVHKPIASYGVDSVEAAGLTADMEDWLGVEIPMDLIWEWATPRELAERVSEYVSSEAGGAIKHTNETAANHE